MSWEETCYWRYTRTDERLAPAKWSEDGNYYVKDALACRQFILCGLAISKKNNSPDYFIDRLQKLYYTVKMSPNFNWKV